MRDTDWRPSTCPDCGSIRPAAENPVCPNENCKPMESLTMSIPEQPVNKRQVMAFKSQDGRTHPSLQAAVQHDVAALIDETDEGFDEALIAGYLVSPQYRRRLISLLKELD